MNEYEKLKIRAEDYNSGISDINITSDGTLTFTIKDKLGKYQTVTYENMSLEELNEFVRLLARINDCLSDKDNHLTVYYDYALPYKIGVINNDKNITYYLEEYSQRAILKKEIELSESVNELERECDKVAREIFYDKQKDKLLKSERKLAATLKQDDAKGLIGAICAFCNNPNAGIKELNTAIRAFYNDLLLRAYNDDKYYIIIGHEFWLESRCMEADILNRIIKGGSLFLEQYEKMIIDNNKSENKRTEEEIRKSIIDDVYFYKINVSENNNVIADNEDYFRKQEGSERPVFQDLFAQQKELLTEDEKAALILYKTCFYKEINEIVRFTRSKDMNYITAINTSYEDRQYIFNILKNGYDRYCKGVTADEKEALDNKMSYSEMFEKNPKAVVNIFSKFENYTIPNENVYNRMILECTSLLETALKKCCLSEDIVVYRGIANENCDITKDHGYLSTSLSFEEAEKFSQMSDRSNNGPVKPQVYKIIVPKGSSVVCFNNALFYANASDKFREPQQEILIDIDNYDLELVSTDGYYETKTVFSPIYRLKPKKLVADLNEGDGHLGL